jgi:hypothetical protein
VKANALNDRLRGDYPAGYSLDATHAPHVSLLQRFVRATDLAIYQLANSGTASKKLWQSAGSREPHTHGKGTGASAMAGI